MDWDLKQAEMDLFLLKSLGSECPISTTAETIIVLYGLVNHDPLACPGLQSCLPEALYSGFGAITVMHMGWTVCLCRLEILHWDPQSRLLCQLAPRTHSEKVASR